MASAYHKTNYRTGGGRMGFKGRPRLGRAPFRRRFKGRMGMRQKYSANTLLRNKERKVVDVASLNFLPTNVGTVTCVGNVLQGAGYMNRIGSITAMQSIELKLDLQPNNAATVAGGDYIRFALVYDRSPNKLLPSYADIFQRRDLNGAPASDVKSGVNMDNRDRFIVLMDKVFSVASNPINGVAQIDNGLNFMDKDVTEFASKKIFIKTKGLKTVYNNTNGGTFADINEGAFFIVSIGSQGAAQAGFSIFCELRFRFID